MHFPQIAADRVLADLRRKQHPHLRHLRWIQSALICGKVFIDAFEIETLPII